MGLHPEQMLQQDGEGIGYGDLNSPDAQCDDCGEEGSRNQEKQDGSGPFRGKNTSFLFSIRVN